ncbi:peptidase M48 [Leptolyngbya valderiana BDU 20041]|uniref:M48 family metallopeptidase n=1 Tax=Baaleninema simplex TaxID=2862350 RepID=UPI0003489B47|nr:M48 family metallopeptidase [Baaleninema simplex]OAB56289.1 peptidase M48 [Leptolyngbya valderiana BDU 20041]
MPQYPGISSEAFRHPLDREAEETLRNLPGFDMVAKTFVEFVYERPQSVFKMGNCIEVGPRQYSTVYHVFRECVRDLDIAPEPLLFVSQDPQLNAYSLGQDHPSMTLNSGLLDATDEAQLRTVIAHELGHIKCGHTILIQMALWAISTAMFVGEMTFGLGNAIGSGLIYAFYEWRRKAELSADRAALLATDDLDSVMQTMMVMAGGSRKYAHELSLNEFIRQSERYQDLDRDNLNQIYKFLLYNGAQGIAFTHPFAVERLYYLREWANSSEYRQIRAGNYQRDDARGAVDVDPTPENQAASLRRQIEELQREIEREKAKRERR